VIDPPGPADESIINTESARRIEPQAFERSSKHVDSRRPT